MPIRIGELLTTIKNGQGHGNWLKFVENSLPFSERAAQHYMFLFRHREEIKSTNIADLNITQALRSLMPKRDSGEPPAPEPPGSYMQKAELITSVSRIAREGIEKLGTDLIEQFKCDLLAFKDEWLRKHAPAPAATQAAKSMGGRK